MMKQELPQLVDERRFRRRDQEQQPPVERDEFGRVSDELVAPFGSYYLTANSANGPRRRFRLPLSQSTVLTFVLKLWDTAGRMSSTSSKRPAVVYRSKGVVPVTWKLRLAARAMRTCSFTLRKLALFKLFYAC